MNFIFRILHTCRPRRVGEVYHVAVRIPIVDLRQVAPLLSTGFFGEGLVPFGAGQGLGFLALVVPLAQGFASVLVQLFR